ncbi:HAMP domain-containing sensor histidine kinase [Paenibacillus gansuensis]|uniref:histidine kinase n=1 Tax=Paenibacillus gansuensis TaxID=306542 RepID=A0ABW5PLQ5_9BACL
MKSLRSRIVLNFGVIIVSVVLVLSSLFVTAVRQYYYGSAEQALDERASVYTALYSKYLWDRSLVDKSRYILENLTEDDFTKVEVVDLQGRLIIDSNGFSSEDLPITSDIASAVEGKRGTWTGTPAGGMERIMAVTYPLRDKGQVVGVIRYTTSIADIDAAVRTITVVTIGLCVAIIILSLFTSLLLARRMIRPVQELTQTARVMARGDFHHRAVKRNDDEIGHLADTMNYMAEEIERNEKLKSDFISSVSHELRTPLTSIKGWSETLMSGGLEERDELLMGLSVISRESQRLTGLVEDLLDFSKLQSPAARIESEPVDVRRLLSQMAEQYAVERSRRGIRLETSGPEEPLYVSGDADRLRQVLLNLIENAIKFTAEDGLIRVTAEAEGAETVRLQVSDSGAGISPEDLPYVTRKFYKGDKKRSGSGLGLAISQEIVQLHCGTMELQSRLGEGTVVTVRLPRLLPAPGGGA